MRYGGQDLSLSANAVLGTDLKDTRVASPYSRCISKSVARNAGASMDAMLEWEANQDRSKNVVPFPENRLMPPKAVVNPSQYEPFAELYDDKTLPVYANNTATNDSWKAGYNYELLRAILVDGTQSTEYIINSSNIDSENSSSTNKVYKVGWLTIDMKIDDGSEDKIAYELGTHPGGYYYKDLGDGYAIIGGMIELTDASANTGEDRYAKLFFRATPIDGIYNYVSEDFKCVQPNKTNLEFDITYYHYGPNSDTEPWVSYPADSTNTITLTHTASANSALDLAVVLPGLDTNGTYWDSTGWVSTSGSQSPFENTVSVSKSAGSSTFTIDWAAIREYVGTITGGLGITFYVYGCWDQLRNGGTSDGHLIGDYNAATTISASGMSNHTVNVKAAGNLNKTSQESSIRSNYTCMYKVAWKTGRSTIKVMPLEGADLDFMNAGVYGQIYPTSGFTRNSDASDFDRTYVGSSSVVNNNQASVSVTSTINNSPASYTITQYFPPQSDEYTETYTINGQQLTKNNSVSIAAGTNTLNINFGNINPTSARWLTLQQDGSPEYANISFTFNE